MSKLCPQCGAPIDEGAVKCEWCGAAITADAGAPIDTPFTPVDTSSSDFGDITPNNNADVSLPLKSRIVAGLLAILLGDLGIHKFYLGQIGKGILYILFCWTYIPAIIAFIEGIMILCKSDTDFEVKYNCRTK